MRVDLSKATLEDKYTVERGRVFLTGTQALIRLLMLQRARDQMAGVNTAGFVSGYRGSPLGGLDQALWRAQPHLARHHVRFQPGVNEDLAATAIWGTQQVTMYPKAKYDGVFGMWYGKGPGVDRCGDVFKHANAAGTAKHGGVLVLAGDDHAAKSSTLPHQSEHIFKACLIPHLNPSSVQDYLDLGLHGYAMSRFSGCWVAFKCVTDVVESGASAIVDPERVKIRIPDFALPPGGLNIRWPDGILEQEARILDYKVYAAIAYARANGLDRVVWDSPRARLGIATTGKSFGDVMQALADLGITEEVARAIGLRVYKVALSWPLEPQGARRFAEGLEEILVVEEKRQVIEYQIKEELYNWKEGVRAPRVVGKFDDNGEWSRAEGQPAGTWLLPAHYEHSPAMVARAIAQRLEKLGMTQALGSQFRERLAFLDFKDKLLAKPRVTAIRQPYFCSGCPHNTSTRVPEGSRALAGIGCHFMAQWMDRNTATFTHMGAEGVPWVGQAPFTEEKHIFANIGDGTYFHSGLLAIRAAVAAKVNMTYKILYNDAVAMTGGQRHDGPLDPAMISRQIAAEGVKPVVVVTDEPEKYPAGTAWAPGVTVQHRDELDRVQRELRDTPGVSAIIYDQTCASEKRRRRKRNQYPDPAKRVVINERVCEGCGDCSVKSNCLSVEPLETEYGRKRAINQSSCNKDYSCVKGFCPSFVTVEGGRLRKGRPASKVADDFAVPEPAVPPLAERYGILVTGIGGTGVITIGQIIGMAAHLEEKGVAVLDMSGLAQKYGAVMSHVQLAPRAQDVHATRLDTGGAHLVLGCDLVVTASTESVAKMAPKRTRAVVNATVAPTAEFVKNPDWRLPGGDLQQDIRDSVQSAEFVAATELATALMGDAIATNMFVLGYAYQKGWLPLVARSARARDRAERRCGGVQQGELPLGAPRRRGPRKAAPHRHTGGSRRHGRASLAQPGRGRGAAQPVSRRLPGRGLRVALQESCRTGAQGRRGESRRYPARRGGGAGLSPAPCVQGRVRGGAPACRWRPREEDRRHVRGRLHGGVPPRAALDREARSGERRAAQDALRPLDPAGIQDPEAASLPERNRVRSVRAYRGAPHGARAHRRIRGLRRAPARGAHAAEPRPRGADRIAPRGDARLWLHQEAQRRGGAQKAR